MRKKSDHDPRPMGNVMKARPCVSADEMPAALAPIWHYFGQNPPSDDAIKHFRRVLPHERVHAGFDGETIVAGTGAFPFDLMIPGGQVKAAGVTVTCVLPTHRRRGYLRALQRSLIDDARARGEPVAVLWATEDTIYGQFGYGMASMAAEIDTPRDRAAPFAQIPVRGDARLVPLAETEVLVAPIYERVTRVTPGMFSRTSAWWQDRVLNDMEWKRRGGGFLQCAVLEIDGRPAAYALYRINSTFARGVQTGNIFVVEAMGDTPEAENAIWRFLLDIDWLARVKASFLPLDHPLLLSLADPRRLNFLVREGLWIRLIDAGAALSARGYATDDAIVVEVADEFCPWNAGRWRIARTGTEKTNAEPDLACDIASLGCVYLGGFTFAQLARSLRMTELRAGAIARADAMFRSDRAPWCPELF
ncbi:MAG: GNAT family N-acetyltransferase [Xanthobacteraceae bacterium]